MNGFADICGEKYSLAGRLWEFDVTMFMGFATLRISVYLLSQAWKI